MASAKMETVAAAAPTESALTFDGVKGYIWTSAVCSSVAAVFGIRGRNLALFGGGLLLTFIGCNNLGNRVAETVLTAGGSASMIYAVYDTKYGGETVARPAAVRFSDSMTTSTVHQSS